MHSGSATLISAIASTGWSINATVEGTVNSKMLLDYLKQFFSAFWLNIMDWRKRKLLYYG